MVVEEVESCDGSPGSAFTPLSAAAVQEQRDYQRSRGCRIQPRGQVGAANAAAALYYLINAGKNILMKTDLQFLCKIRVNIDGSLHISLM